jgi:hypothetical protein
VKRDSVKECPKCYAHIPGWDELNERALVDLADAFIRNMVKELLVTEYDTENLRESEQEHIVDAACKAIGSVGGHDYPNKLDSGYVFSDGSAEGQSALAAITDVNSWWEKCGKEYLDCAGTIERAEEVALYEISSWFPSAS